MNKNQIKQDFIEIKAVCKELAISKQALYNRLKKHQIKTVKKGRKAFLLKENIEKIKGTVNPTRQLDSQVYSQVYSQPKNLQENEEKQLNKEQSTLSVKLDSQLEEELRGQIKELKEKSEQLEMSVQQKSEEVGLWKGRSKTLEEQMKLLEDKRNTVEETKVTKSSVDSWIIKVLITLGILGGIGWMLLKNGIF